MSLNIMPVYGKQLIRFSETFQAATSNQTGTPNTVELHEFRAVCHATYAEAGTVCPPAALTTPPTTIVGINQSYIPSVAEQPHTARQATVATSGSLLMEVAPADAGTPTAGAPLRINTLGQAVFSGGTLVTLNGTAPTYRELIKTGGRKMVLVSLT